MLYRGYVTVNLLPTFGWAVAAAASIVLFTAVHLLTDRADAAQVTSWAVAGALLMAAYLLSGSLWVAIAVHFLTDLTNVVASGIVGRYIPLSISSAPPGSWRLGYRAASSTLIAALLLGAYGPQVGVPSGASASAGRTAVRGGALERSPS